VPGRKPRWRVEIQVNTAESLHGQAHGDGRRLPPTGAGLVSVRPAPARNSCREGAQQLWSIVTSRVSSLMARATNSQSQAEQSLSRTSSITANESTSNSRPSSSRSASI
jgi:hypothetical protein